MKKISIIVIGLLLLFSCNNSKKNSYENLVVETSVPSTIDWKAVQNYYYDNMEVAILYLDSLAIKDLPKSKSKFYFKELRRAFKIAEPYASYLNPDVGHRANGPALSIYKEDSGKIVTAVGLQKLEETLYGEIIVKEDVDREVYILKGFLGNLKNGIKERKLNPQRFFVATHQQLMRLVSLAMAGFDTPVSGLSISETAISLKSLSHVYDLSIRPLVQGNNINLDRDFNKNIENAISFIGKEPNFITFDRYTFIRNYLNPITRNWVAIRKSAAIWETKSNSYPFNFNAPTFFEEDSFNVNFFLDVNDQNPSAKKIALGEKLFFDKNLSKNGTMSCATCHIASKGYADGLKLGKDNKGNLLVRNTPTLLNSVYQQSFFWDGRANTIVNQIGIVFSNKKEFNSSIHQFSENILEDSNYANLIKDAYGIIPKKNTEIIRAISTYIATLKSFNSKFDKNIRAEENTFTKSEKRGFNLFMGKALCATCHFMPLTNGTVPPFFSETEKEVIGVPETSENKKLDDDYGFYSAFKEQLHKGMFKTPTVRNAALTAPYMHNGVYNTLEEVIDFYVKGGGAGLGFDVPHQTLPFDKLAITDQDQKDLIAFIKTLTDAPEKLY